jgi:DNA-binding NarL/FixJ family response regulator
VTPLVAPRPLGPLIDAVAGLNGAAWAGLAAAVDAGDTARLYRQLLGALGDGGRSVWLIEDAHWADGATLDLMRFLARRVAAVRLLLVISFRDDELAPTHPLAVTLGDLANCAAVSRMGLEPLSSQAVAALAAGSGINAEELHQITGGNPFFVTEVLAAGPDALTRKGLPHSISEAVCGRVARLSAKARETAHAVAVCGPRADVALLDKMCPDARPALYECLDIGALVAEGDLVGFRHELARRADKLSDPHALTGRQRQVFDLLAAGRSNPEIAAELHISPKTVGHHVEAILAKLGVENRTHAVAYALQSQAPPQSQS